MESFKNSKKSETACPNFRPFKISVIQHAFPKIALIGYQTIAFILSFFRKVINKSNQIDSLKKAQDDPKICGKSKGSGAFEATTKYI